MDAAPETEVEALRRRVAELEQQLRGAHLNGKSPVSSRAAQSASEQAMRLSEEVSKGTEPRAEIALQESEGRFRHLADHAPVMVWVTEANGSCTYLSRSWYEFTGQTPETGLGFGWVDATHPDDKKEAERSFVEANSRHSAFRLEYRLRRKDGVYRWAIDAAVPRLGPQGEFLGYVGSVLDITERRQTEEALRESEAKYRTLFESMDQGFCILQMIFDDQQRPVDYRFLEVNPMFQEQTGLRNAVGRTARELVPDLEPFWFNTYCEVALTGTPTRFVNQSEPLGRWFEVYAFRIGTPEERQVALLFSDITARKHTESLRLLRNRVLELAIEDTPLEEVLSQLVRAVESLSSSEVLASTLLRDGERLRHGAAPSLPDAYNAAIDGIAIGPAVGSCGTAAHGRAPVFVSDIASDPLWANFRELALAHGLRACWSTPILSGRGEVLGTFAMYYRTPREPAPADLELVEFVARSAALVIERKQLEQALLASKDRLQQVFQQAPVAIVVFRGREFIVELANPSYRALLKGRELEGRPFADAVPELSSDVWDAFHRVMDTGEPFVRDDFHVSYDQDGDGVNENHWFNVVYHPLRDAAGTVSGMVAVSNEVTSQVLARQELERVNRGLEEFAYVASHDLQEPLRMVNSYAQLLVRRLGPEATEEQRQFAGFVQQGVKRMEKLIKDLLSYSRTVHTVGEIAGSEASLDDALRQALTAVEARVAETGAAITHGPLPTLRGEMTQFSHVFQNLLSNALKYQRLNTQPNIHISAKQEKGEWIVSVCDNGIGFDPSQAERIFGLFKRLHRDDEYPGTGLGLAICKRIIERYGGRMWAESEPGVGSTFFFSLPVVL